MCFFDDRTPSDHRDYRDPHRIAVPCCSKNPRGGGTIEVPKQLETDWLSPRSVAREQWIGISDSGLADRPPSVPGK